VTDAVVRVAAVQAAPVYLDLGGTVEKAIGLIEEAAKAGAHVIGFPETWIPGYPWWVWLGAPSWGLQFQKRYHQNALRRDSAEMAALCDAARRNAINVVLGYAERDGGSLYMSQSIIADDGTSLVHRRKLKPARTERQVFGEGDGGDLAVVETKCGRLGALCCAEHFQPLLKFAMYAEREEIHVAAWPGFSLMRGKAYLNGPQAATIASQMYAIEGQCFVIAATTVNDEAMLSTVCDTPDKRAMLTVEGKDAAGGASMIFAPDGRPLGEPIPEDQEGLVYADLDLSDILLAKTAADALGHFSRPDVVRLMVNRKHAPKIVSYSGAFDTVMNDETAGEKADA
jgi:aliphatic nitrilase